MASPTWQANGSPTATATLSTRTPTLPAHAADDILVVMAIHNGAANLSIAAGWTDLVGAPEGNLNMSTGIWWKRAASGAETNPLVTSTVAADASNVLTANSFNIRGCITTGDPYEAGAFSGSPVSSVSPASTAITTLGADRLAVCFGFFDANTSISSIPPATWTTEEDVTTATGGTAAYRIIGKDIAAAALVPSVTVGTLSTARYWRTLTVAFIPPGGVTTSSPPGFFRRQTNPLLLR